MKRKKIINFLDKNFKNPRKSVKYNFSPELCPDQYVAYFKYNNEWEIDSSKNNILDRGTVGKSKNLDVNYNSINQKDYYILIILESPHYDEYDLTSHKPFGPACGKTGAMFNKYFADIINQMVKQQHRISVEFKQAHTYRIVFMNAVQYQASEGRQPIDRDRTDFNWLKLWNSGFSEDLIRRIKAYPENNRVVINLCTLGNNNLRYIVKLKLTNNSIKHHCGYHPCTWNIKKNRVLLNF